jgi:hypothetical protein
MPSRISKTLKSELIALHQFVSIWFFSAHSGTKGNKNVSISFAMSACV